VIDRIARLAADEAKLSTRMGQVQDILVEADYWATQRGAAMIDAVDVDQAVAAQIRRQDRARDRLYEQIDKGVLQIATEGEVVGQINGLTVLEIGQFAFGAPARITATTRLGEGEVVDIEREVEMGGPIHSKGVFILSSFLGTRYSADSPLSLSASLTFEQSYAGVEGDSASLAELCVLLSSLARAPLDQGVAVTGSVDQQGNVQAIGGVNEKIEGFFAICRQRGLTGRQAVIIPHSNTAHLMLSHEVRAAVAEGTFAVYPVSHLDQALGLLTGEPAGEADDAGQFPEGTLNARVQARLQEFAELRHSFASSEKSSA
jgi:predicted ATP-dependent protease